MPPSAAEIHDHAIEAIDEAITRFRADLRATERKLIDGEWVEVPVLQIGPRDLALLIDRLQILFGRPAMISEGHGFVATIASEAIPVDVLKGIVEATRGLAGTPAPEASPCRDCLVGPELSDMIDGSSNRMTGTEHEQVATPTPADRGGDATRDRTRSRPEVSVEVPGRFADPSST